MDDETFIKFESFPEILQFAVLLEMRYPDLEIFCDVTPSGYNICEQETFWEQKLEKDYSAYFAIEKEEDTWKETYWFYRNSKALDALIDSSNIVFENEDDLDYEKMEKFLERELADVNDIGYTGQTPLTSAVFSGDEDMVILLLEYGADPNQADSYGDLPLNYNLISYEILKELLEHGANPNQIDVSESYPLENAIKSGNEEAVKLLLDYGASQ